MTATRATIGRLQELRKATKHHALTLAARQLLDYHLGVVSYTKVKVPFLDSTVAVRTSTFWRYFEQGRWKRRCIKHMVDIVKEGDVLQDIGAWLGPYTILFSKLVGPQGFVYSFEPEPGAFSHLRDNMRANQLSNVLAEKSALANHGGSLTLAATRLGGSLTSAIRTNSTAKEQFAAHATTIDAYCGRNRIHPKGLKIDVEGWEGAVIKGGLGVGKMSPVVAVRIPRILNVGRRQGRQLEVDGG